MLRSCSKKENVIFYLVKLLSVNIIDIKCFNYSLHNSHPCICIILA
jgi:hypothetical protein